jgi:hypothetical protein
MPTDVRFSTIYSDLSGFLRLRAILPQAASVSPLSSFTAFSHASGYFALNHSIRVGSSRFGSSVLIVLLCSEGLNSHI